MSDTASSDEISLEKENRSLRRRVDELERTLSDMETTSLVGVQKKEAARWKIAVFGILLIVVLSPSYLVLRDRWLENRVNIAAVNQIWWDTPSLKALAYPQYFLLIFLFTLLTVLIVSVWRECPLLFFSNFNLGEAGTAGTQNNGRRSRTGHYLLLGSLVIANLSAFGLIFSGRLPGWELILALILFVAGQFLLDPSTSVYSERLRMNGGFLLDAALLIVALCCALYASFGEEKPNLIFYVFLLLAILNFLRHRRQAPVIFWISLASLIVLTWDINSWHYVVIGDEYSFYTEILNILDNRTAWQLVNNTFNGNLVYGTHPYFSSYIQDVFLKLFDNHNFGWRFSNPVLVACSLPFFYYFFKAFLTRRTALVTVVLLGFSHYLLSFSKIGYNNLQALFGMSLVLASFTWSLQSMRTIAFSLTGLAMGLCFYLYPAAIYVIPLPVIGLLIFMPPVNREALKRWGWMLASLALLIYPLMGQFKYWEAKIPGTFLYGDAGGSLLQNISKNLLYSAFSFLYIPEQTHYVSIGYLDLLSSAFVIIGFVLLIKSAIRRNRSALLFASTFAMMFFIVGATHGRQFPTATRMFLLLPWFALFAALGLEWTVDVTGSLFNLNARTLGNILVGMIVILNIYQTYVVDVINTAQYQSLPAMFIKIAREIKANPEVPPESYAFVTVPGWDTSGIKVIQRAYRVPDSPRQILDLPVDGNQLPATDQELVTQRDVVVIVRADLDPGLMTQVDAQLAGWGKAMCEIRNEKGTLQFQLWHSGDLGWLCQ